MDKTEIPNTKEGKVALKLAKKQKITKKTSQASLNRKINRFSKGKIGTIGTNSRFKAILKNNLIDTRVRIEVDAFKLFKCIVETYIYNLIHDSCLLLCFTNKKTLDGIHVKYVSTMKGAFNVFDILDLSHSITSHELIYKSTIVHFVEAVWKENGFKFKNVKKKSPSTNKQIDDDEEDDIAAVTGGAKSKSRPNIKPEFYTMISIAVKRYVQLMLKHCNKILSYKLERNHGRTLTLKILQKSFDTMVQDCLPMNNNLTTCSFEASYSKSNRRTKAKK